MAENNRGSPIPKEYDLNAKWDACLDLSLRRFVYSSLAGAFTGLLLFRSPATRWASVAFGAGVGLGSAYEDCSHLFDKPPTDITSSKVSREEDMVISPLPASQVPNLPPANKKLEVVWWPDDESSGPTVRGRDGDR